MAAQAIPHIYAQIVKLTVDGRGSRDFQLSDGSLLSYGPGADYIYRWMQESDHVLIDFSNWNDKSGASANIFIFRRRTDSPRIMNCIFSYGQGKGEPGFEPKLPAELREKPDGTR